MGASSWLGGTVYLAWLGGRGGHAAAVRPAWRGGRAADRRRGLVSSAGAAVYGLRRPDPAPAVLGYHEVFHLLVVAGMAAQFLAISLYALPTG
jgi:Haemolysin-III related